MHTTDRWPPARSPRTGRADVPASDRASPPLRPPPPLRHPGPLTAPHKVRPIPTNEQPKRQRVPARKPKPAGTAAFVPLKTERLILRRWRAADRAAYVAMLIDPEVGYWLIVLKNSLLVALAEG